MHSIFFNQKFLVILLHFLIFLGFFDNFKFMLLWLASQSNAIAIYKFENSQEITQWFKFKLFEWML